MITKEELERIKRGDGLTVEYSSRKRECDYSGGDSNE